MTPFKGVITTTSIPTNTSHIPRLFRESNVWTESICKSVVEHVDPGKDCLKKSKRNRFIHAPGNCPSENKTKKPSFSNIYFFGEKYLESSKYPKPKFRQHILQHTKHWILLFSVHLLPEDISLPIPGNLSDRTYTAKKEYPHLLCTETSWQEVLVELGPEQL